MSYPLSSHSSTRAPSFELRFPSLSLSCRTMTFPCDAGGIVTLDALSERARSNYLFARALLGRDYGQPRILRSSAPVDGLRPSIH